MHNYATPDYVRTRVQRRTGGRPYEIEPQRSALVVIDMQNHFVAEGYASEVPMARQVVPNINTLAQAVRQAGGTVVWVQTTARGALETWANHHAFGLAPDVAARRLKGLDEAGDGFKLYPALDVQADDRRVKKIKFSALIGDSSNLREVLQSLNVDNLFIAGTLTNVCCDSTARDAMMLDYRVALVSDANAALTDEEHAAALNGFQLFFGRVLTTEEAVDTLNRHRQ